MIDKELRKTTVESILEWTVQQISYSNSEIFNGRSYLSIYEFILRMDIATQ